MSRIKRQGILNIMISYLGIGLGFFIIIFKARLFTTEELGVLSIITTIAVLSGFIVNFGLHSVISKFYYRAGNNEEKKNAMLFSLFSLTIANFIAVSLILLIFKDFILLEYNNSLLSNYFYVIFIIIFAESLNKIWISLFLVQFKSVLCNFINDFFFKTSSFVLLFLVYISLITFSHFIILFSLLYVFRVFLFLFFFLVDFKWIKPDFRVVNKSNIKVALNYSFFMFFGGLAGILTKTIDKLMLGAFLNIEVVGIYSIIITFPILIQTIGNAFSMTAHAQISKYWQEDNIEGIKSLYRENAGLQMFLGFFFLGTFSIFGRELLLFIGEEYVGAYTAFVFLLVGEFINISTGMCGGIISYSKFYRFDFYIRTVLVLFTILSNLIFIPLWGLNGAAFATALSLILYNILKFTIVKVKIGLHPYSLESVAVVVSGAVFFAFVYFIQKYIQLENVLAIIGFSLFSFLLYLFYSKVLFKFSFLKNLKQFVRK
ncbi:MAG: oligosaccharide flippase family protein [Spirochaetaceae bacterium]|nr:oligosaccharide flippase family protein [Spirochaetaceae bacterium]